MAVANDNPLGRDADSLLAAGDSRANVQPMLIAFHTLFVREHNRLCDEYKNKYPQVIVFPERRTLKGWKCNIFHSIFFFVFYKVS